MKIRDFTKTKLPRKQKEGDYDICKAVKEIEDVAVEKGIVQGIEQERISAVKNIL